MNGGAKWFLAAAGGMVIGALAWGGTTLVTLGNKVAVLEAEKVDGVAVKLTRLETTQEHLIKTIDRALNELDK